MGQSLVELLPAITCAIANFQTGRAVISYDPKTNRLLSFYDAVPGFLEGGDTPRAYLERCIETIEARESDIGAFASIDLAAARRMADASTLRFRDGQPLSPVDGMPVGIKDLFKTRDLPTGLGSPLYKDRRHTLDSAHVWALRRGGAVIVGKTATPELGSGKPPPTRNPFDLDRSPGASSSGSGAAVGAAMLPVATASQGRGSILRPASFCANVALKPTFGALHCGGLMWRSPSYGVLGIHAATIEDCWMTAQHIASVVGGDPGYPGLFGPPAMEEAVKPTRLVVLETAGWTRTEPKTKERFNAYLDTLRAAGIQLVGRKEEEAVEKFEQALLSILTFRPALAAWEIRWPALPIVELEGDGITPEFSARLRESEEMSLDDYRRALAALGALRRDFARFEDFADGYITLCTPTMPPPYPETGDSVFGDVSSSLGAPAWSLPLLEDRGLPMGVQLMGNPHRDYELGCIGRWLMAQMRDAKT